MLCLYPFHCDVWRAKVSNALAQTCATNIKSGGYIVRGSCALDARHARDLDQDMKGTTSKTKTLLFAIITSTSLFVKVKILGEDKFPSKSRASRHFGTPLRVDTR